MAKGKRKIVLVAHNIRSAHNVGSLLRTADGLAVEVFLTGYSPYPAVHGDKRLPHIRTKVSNQIHKTALGAEDSAKWQYIEDIDKCLGLLKDRGYVVAALEQAPGAQNLKDFRPPPKIGLVVGNEVEGLGQDTLSKTSQHLQIPMLGAKESFNVAVAAAMALYHLRNS